MIRQQRWTMRLVALASLAVAPGCAGFWDEVTSRDFHVRNWWTTDDPLIVLRDSTDGWKRAKAIARLSDPKTKEDQENYFKILSAAALSDNQPMCRLAAIEVLGKSKDPRAPKILEDVYVQRLPFTPELAKVVRQQALSSLELTGEANARHMFIRVARQPGADATSATADHLQTLDERLAAIRALSKYPQADSVETLIHLMETDRDVAIRSRAWDSLKTATHKDIPNDPKLWREMFATGKEPPPPTLAEKAAGWMPNIEFHHPPLLPQDGIFSKLTSAFDKKSEAEKKPAAPSNAPAEGTQQTSGTSIPGTWSRFNPFRRDEDPTSAQTPPAAPQPGPLRRLFQGQDAH